MIKTVFFTLIFLALTLIMLLHYLNLARINLDVNITSGEFFPKDRVIMSISLRNKGLSGRYFFIDVRSDLRGLLPQTVYLEKGSEYSRKLDFIVPEQTMPGNYFIDVAVRTTGSAPFGSRIKPKTIAEKRAWLRVVPPPVKEVKIPEPKKITKEVAKPPEPLTGTLKFSSLPDGFHYSFRHKVVATAENTGDRAATFYILLNIAGPEGAQKSYSKEMTISSSSAETAEFEVIFVPEDAPGQYFAVGELRDVHADRLLFSDSAVLSLVDMPPDAEIRDIIVSPADKNRYEIISKVSDDTGISGVELYYRDFKRNYTTSYSMNLSFGDRKNGLWTVSFIPYKKSRNFTFFAEAVDVRNGVSRSEERSSIEAAGAAK